MNSAMFLRVELRSHGVGEGARRTARLRPAYSTERLLVDSAAYLVCGFAVLIVDPCTRMADASAQASGSAAPMGTPARATPKFRVLG